MSTINIFDISISSMFILLFHTVNEQKLSLLDLIRPRSLLPRTQWDVTNDKKHLIFVRDLTVRSWTLFEWWAITKYDTRYTTSNFLWLLYTYPLYVLLPRVQYTIPIRPTYFPIGFAPRPQFEIIHICIHMNVSRYDFYNTNLFEK